ncbi:hypothetical protein TSTA_096890 [Talaromyces stipitatus ATCC 10500]|uniref:FAD-binding domain-containing protein n=1 Tax=Talaromyces stipitatus (strain ATCC 10500 / CBS 375.48 / QM 6759 / NRRL 1006) TaxID=441959 RepID=B8LZL7_TALSN|nr:uncharacterized protein TSTA_096890 [Talaromyces stipitatus ATCC 10500]EED22440.1 hypothetical protein TSTA_096890 [Talaromyces stipitatus ATCC 10500]
MARSTIRVAIVGGGMAGGSLLHAFIPHLHLDVHIFESASAFRQAGMAIGVARNALDTLDLLGAVPVRHVRFMLAQGEGIGNMIDQANDDDG